MDSRRYRDWPSVGVKVTNHLVKINSMQNDGTESWVVISRGMNKHVTGLPEEHQKPIHNEEMGLGAKKPLR